SRRVFCDRVELAVTGSGQALRCESLAFDQQLDQRGSARGGQLPVGSEGWSVDGNIVRVAFDAQRTVARFEKTGNPVDGSDRLRLDLRRAAVKEPDLAQADDQSVSIQPEGDFAPLDLRRQ